jgi:SH3-like domain-containing protein
MHERARWLMVTLVLCAAGTAVAVKPGEPLHVKARNTRLMASAAPTANVVAILQPGQKVTWLGADPKSKQWHQVRAEDGKKGVVFQSNLSTKPPNMELIATEGGRQVDPKTFANSGAAVKGLSNGAIQYGKGQKAPGFSEAVDQLQQVEQLAEKITPAELAEHASKAGLFPVVGPKATASRGGK